MKKLFKNKFKKMSYANRLHVLTMELWEMAEQYPYVEYADAESIAIDIAYLRGAAEHLLKMNNDTLSRLVGYAEQSKNLTPKSFDVDPFAEYG